MELKKILKNSEKLSYNNCYYISSQNNEKQQNILTHKKNLSLNGTNMELKKILKNSENIFCECCNYTATRLHDFKTHLLTSKHLLNVNGNNEALKNNVDYFQCSTCNFITSKKSNFEKHILSKKHINENKKNVDTNLNCCSICDKKFVYASGLWKHKQKCFRKEESENLPKNVQENTQNSGISTDLVLEILKQNKDLQNVLIEQNKQIIELSKNNSVVNSNNNNTNNFNLQFFLNETCKDAMNITDFVNSLQLSVKDFETTGRIGYVEGISRIIINGLKQIDTNKRPVHCTDLKRETVYIKHENEWEKDNPDKKKLKWAINSVAQLNLKQLHNWQLENPECINMDTRQNEDLIKYSLSALGGQYKEEEEKYMDKIMKNVLKKVTVSKE
jgi:hypothetical protein